MAVKFRELRARDLKHCTEYLYTVLSGEGGDRTSNNAATGET